MDVRAIRTEDDYNWALAEITRYFENEPEVGTPDGNRFDVLATLIEAYEDKHYPIIAPDPIDAIAAYMEMAGLKQADFAIMIGSRSRASEVMNRKRALTVDMIHKLNTKWRLPSDVLVRPYHLSGRGSEIVEAQMSEDASTDVALENLMEATAADLFEDAIEMRASA